VPKKSNIYHLVERAAARPRIATPRMELWQLAAEALVKKELATSNSSMVINPTVYPKMTFGDWLIGFRAAVNRGNDPSGFSHILKLIIVGSVDFEKWLRKAIEGRGGSERGPETGTTGYQASDRKLFHSISRLIGTGQVRGAYGAAQRLIEAGKVAGTGHPDNRAKRLSTLYLKEHQRKR
jgi:hypothetical protein